MRIGRPLLAALAVVACAWFALSARQAHDLDAATAILTQSATPTAAELAHASSLLSSAGQLNPGEEVNIARARLASLAGQPAKAKRIAEQVTHDEPQSASAWLLLANVAGHDSKTLFRALGKVNQLAPPPPGSH